MALVEGWCSIYWQVANAKVVLSVLSVLSVVVVWS